MPNENYNWSSVGYPQLPTRNISDDVIEVDVGKCRANVHLEWENPYEGSFYAVRSYKCCLPTTKRTYSYTTDDTDWHTITSYHSCKYTNCGELPLTIKGQVKALDTREPMRTIISPSHRRYGKSQRGSDDDGYFTFQIDYKKKRCATFFVISVDPYENSPYERCNIPISISDLSRTEIILPDIYLVPLSSELVVSTNVLSIIPLKDKGHLVIFPNKFPSSVPVVYCRVAVIDFVDDNVDGIVVPTRLTIDTDERAMVIIPRFMWKLACVDSYGNEMLPREYKIAIERNKFTDDILAMSVYSDQWVSEIYTDEPNNWWKSISNLTSEEDSALATAGVGYSVGLWKSIAFQALPCYVKVRTYFSASSGELEEAFNKRVRLHFLPKVDVDDAGTTSSKYGGGVCIKTVCDDQMRVRGTFIAGEDMVAVPSYYIAEDLAMQLEMVSSGNRFESNLVFDGRPPFYLHRIECKRAGPGEAHFAFVRGDSDTSTAPTSTPAVATSTTSAEGEPVTDSSTATQYTTTLY